MSKHGCGSSSAIYGLGFVGVLVYYLQQAHGLSPVIFAILKSIVWPALLTYRVFDYLKM